MPGAGVLGMLLHVALLVWLAPIAFFDNGHLAPDWKGTFVPFAALAFPLVIASIGRSNTAFGIAAVTGLVISIFFFLTLSAGFLLLLPAISYAYAGLSEKASDG